MVRGGERLLAGATGPAAWPTASPPGTAASTGKLAHGALSPGPILPPPRFPTSSAFCPPAGHRGLPLGGWLPPGGSGLSLSPGFCVQRWFRVPAECPGTRELRRKAISLIRLVRPLCEKGECVQGSEWAFDGGVGPAAF